MKILITGATGYVGQVIGQKLSQKGHKIVVISRSREKAQKQLSFTCEVIEGDLVKGPVTGVPPVDKVIHLMGESVGEGRWTAAKKKRIYSSRIQSTKNLARSFSGKIHIISASGIGYYGDSQDKLLTEDDPPGDDFLAQVCKDWENEVKNLSDDYTIFRIGMVLSWDGGALKKMSLPFKLGIGGALGCGKQWISWILREDLADLFVRAAENNIKGIYNAVSAEPLTNLEFSRKVAEHFGKKLGPRVPAWILKFALGEMSTLVLSSQRASNQKLEQAGFHVSNKFPS